MLRFGGNSKKKETNEDLNYKNYRILVLGGDGRTDKEIIYNYLENLFETSSKVLRNVYHKDEIEKEDEAEKQKKERKEKENKQEEEIDIKSKSSTQTETDLNEKIDSKKEEKVTKSPEKSEKEKKRKSLKIEEKTDIKTEKEELLKSNKSDEKKSLKEEVSEKKSSSKTISPPIINGVIKASPINAGRRNSFNSRIGSISKFNPFAVNSDDPEEFFKNFLPGKEVKSKIELNEFIEDYRKKSKSFGDSSEIPDLKATGSIKKIDLEEGKILMDSVIGKMDIRHIDEKKTDSIPSFALRKRLINKRRKRSSSVGNRSRPFGFDRTKTSPVGYFKRIRKKLKENEKINISKKIFEDELNGEKNKDHQEFHETEEKEKQSDEKKSDEVIDKKEIENVPLIEDTPKKEDNITKRIQMINENDKNSVLTLEIPEITYSYDNENCSFDDEKSTKSEPKKVIKTRLRHQSDGKRRKEKYDKEHHRKSIRVYQKKYNTFKPIRSRDLLLAPRKDLLSSHSNSSPSFANFLNNKKQTPKKNFKERNFEDEADDEDDEFTNEYFGNEEEFDNMGNISPISPTKIKKQSTKVSSKERRSAIKREREKRNKTSGGKKKSGNQNKSLNYSMDFEEMKMNLSFEFLNYSPLEEYKDSLLEFYIQELNQLKIIKSKYRVFQNMKNNNGISDKRENSEMSDKEREENFLNDLNKMIMAHQKFASQKKITAMKTSKKLTEKISTRKSKLNLKKNEWKQFRKESLHLETTLNHKKKKILKYCMNHFKSYKVFLENNPKDLKISEINKELKIKKRIDFVKKFFRLIEIFNISQKKGMEMFKKMYKEHFLTKKVSGLEKTSNRLSNFGNENDSDKSSIESKKEILILLITFLNFKRFEICDYLTLLKNEKLLYLYLNLFFSNDLYLNLTSNNSMSGVAGNNYEDLYSSYGIGGENSYVQCFIRFLTFFQTPKEGQKIVQLVEQFSKVYFEKFGKNSFANSELCHFNSVQQYLLFGTSLLFLHNNLHHPIAAKKTLGSPKRFFFEGNQDIDKSYLENVYNFFKKQNPLGMENKKNIYESLNPQFDLMGRDGRDKRSESVFHSPRNKIVNSRILDSKNSNSTENNKDNESDSIKNSSNSMYGIKKLFVFYKLNFYEISFINFPFNEIVKNLLLNYGISDLHENVNNNGESGNSNLQVNSNTVKFKINHNPNFRTEKISNEIRNCDYILILLKNVGNYQTVKRFVKYLKKCDLYTNNLSVISFIDKIPKRVEFPVFQFYSESEGGTGSGINMKWLFSRIFNGVVFSRQLKKNSNDYKNVNLQRMEINSEKRNLKKITFDELLLLPKLYI